MVFKRRNSGHETDFVLTYGQPETRNDLDPEQSPLEQRLLDTWPASLGTAMEKEFSWDAGFDMSHWFLYNSAGSITESGVNCSLVG